MLSSIFSSSKLSAEFTFSGGTHKYKTDVVIYWNGSTIWLAPAMFITVCHLDVR